MYRTITTHYDTAAALLDGTEYLALPVYEDSVIRAYRLPSGGAAAVRGMLTLPDDAEEVYTAPMTAPDAEAAYLECERVLREELHTALAECTEQEFFTALRELV